VDRSVIKLVRENGAGLRFLSYRTV
jgi:hypothetical protein